MELLESRRLLAGAPFTVEYLSNPSSGGAGVQLSDNDTSPSANDGTDFGSVSPLEDPDVEDRPEVVTHFFRLTRIPGSTYDLSDVLNAGGKRIIGSNGFTLVDSQSPVDEDPSDGTGELQISMFRSPGAKSATVQFNGTDDEGAFTFTFNVAGFVTSEPAQDFGTLGTTPKTDNNEEVSITSEQDGDGQKFAAIVNKTYKFSLPTGGTSTVDIDVTARDDDQEDSSGDLRVVVAEDDNNNGIMDRGELSSPDLDQIVDAGSSKLLTKSGLKAGGKYLLQTSVGNAVPSSGGFGVVTVGYDLSVKATTVAPADVSVTFNGTAISDGDDDPSSNEGTIFPAAQVGQTKPQRVFKIKNTGGSPLTLGAPAFEGNGFDIPTGLPSQLLPGATADLVVEMLTTSAGGKSGVVSFTTNAAGKGTFDFEVSGNVTAAPPPPAPEITLSIQGGASIADGQSDAVDFGAVIQGAAGVTRTFVVKNDGNAPLSLSDLQVPEGFILSDPPPGSIAAGASDTFSLTLASTTVGPSEGTFRFTTSDADETSFDFPIKGVVNSPEAPQVPEISVALDDNISGPGTFTVLTDGQAAPVSFGAATQGSAGEGKMLIISNAGTAPLSVSLGAIPPGFELVEGLDGSTIAPGAFDSIILRLAAAGAAAVRTGDLVITSNDADEGSFDVKLSGVVTLPGQPATPLAVFSIGGAAASNNQTLDFGTRQADAPATVVDVTVSNAGAATLELGPIVPPNGFTLAAPQPTSVAPGGSAMIKLSFSAAAAGTYQGPATIPTNDPALGSFVLNLTGVATPVLADTPPAVITVTNVVPGKFKPSIIAGDPKAKATLSVTIRNDSGAEFNDLVTVEIHASADGLLTAADGGPLAPLSKRMKLKNGASKTLKVNVPLSGAPQGNLTLLGTARARGGVSTAPGPALGVAQPFLNLQGAGNGFVAKPLTFGKRASLAIPVQNSGNVSKTSATYTLVVSNNGALSGEVFRTSVFGKLNAKPGAAARPQKVPVTFQQGEFAGGDYTLLVIVDAELNQTNGLMLSESPFSIS